MQTILTIDDDVAAELERLCRARGMNMDQLVNEALRRGLRDIGAHLKAREPFRTRSFDCGRLLLDNVDCIGEVLAILDAEHFIDVDRRNRLKQRLQG
jgi:hypothetical protein